MDLTSQLTYALIIKVSKSLLSKAIIEVDYGYGIQKVSTYNVTHRILPFKASFLITYNTCDSVLFKTVSLDSPINFTVEFKFESCFSYSASILVSLNFPSNERLFYKLGDEDILQLNLIKD